MACRNTYKTKTINVEADIAKTSITEPAVAKTVNRLLFGVDSAIQANDLLQNNIEEFEWIVRNKIYPNFYGRFLTGENCLTKEEIVFSTARAARSRRSMPDEGAKQTEERARSLQRS